MNVEDSAVAVAAGERRHEDPPPKQAQQAPVQLEDQPPLVAHQQPEEQEEERERQLVQGRQAQHQRQLQHRQQLQQMQPQFIAVPPSEWALMRKQVMTDFQSRRSFYDTNGFCVMVVGGRSYGTAEFYRLLVDLFQREVGIVAVLNADPASNFCLLSLSFINRDGVTIDKQDLRFSSLNTMVSPATYLAKLRELRGRYDRREERVPLLILLGVVKLGTGQHVLPDVLDLLRPNHVLLLRGADRQQDIRTERFRTAEITPTIYEVPAIVVQVV